jgi:hypothetical protein
MEIFWLGSVLNFEGLKRYKGESPANSIWTNLFLRGLKSQNNNITIFAPIWDSLFPKGLIVPGKKKYLSKEFNSVIIHYFNILGIRSISVTVGIVISVLLYIRKKKLSKTKIFLLNYNLYNHYVWACKILIRLNKNIIWVNVNLDLDDPLKDNWKEFLNKSKGSQGNIFLSWWGYVNAPIKSKLHWDFCWDGAKPFINLIPKVKIFVYAGKFADYGGINDLISLISSFKEKDVFFDFYGKDYNQNLFTLSQFDSRVRIHGFVTDDVLEKACSEAWAFLNPRDVNFHGTRMIFPSKILFYLKFKKPILSPPLPGVSPEYLPALTLIENNSNTEWLQAMYLIYNYSEDDFKIYGENIENLLESRKIDNYSKKVNKFLINLNHGQ